VSAGNEHVIVLPGGGSATQSENEGEPIVAADAGEAAAWTELAERRIQDQTEID
jgi:hypothetical protein